MVNMKKINANRNIGRTFFEMQQFRSICSRSINEFVQFFSIFRQLFCRVFLFTTLSWFAWLLFRIKLHDLGTVYA